MRKEAPGASASSRVAMRSGVALTTGASGDACDPAGTLSRKAARSPAARATVENTAAGSFHRKTTRPCTAARTRSTRPDQRNLSVHHALDRETA